jgi:Flp pilus assembly protein TadD
MRRNLFICLLLAGVTLGIYWPAGHFDLIYLDDPYFVTENQDINNGLTWHGVMAACTSVIVGNWHPVTNLTFLATHEFFGVNPGAEHFLNIAIHATNAVLLFLLLYRLTGASWRSFVVAAIFAWHPLRVESVAWIAERKDVLCVFFFLLALLAYGESVKNAALKRRSTVFFILSLLAYVLALLSKPMAVTLPLVMLLLDVWPLKKVQGLRFKLSSWQRPVLEKWPFLLLTLVFCVVTFWVQHNAAAISSTDRIGLEPRLTNIISSYLRYLGKTVWPSDLAIIYPFPVNDHSYLALWPAWQVIAAALALIFFSILTIRKLPYQPYLAVGWFWYLITLLPVIGIVQVGNQGMADRYTYIPMIGLALALVWWVTETFTHKHAQTMLAGLTALWLTGLIWLTAGQLNYWRDTVTLLSHAVDITGDNYLAQLNIGVGHEHQNNMRRAIVCYRTAVAIYPTGPEGYRSLGRVLGRTGQYAAAAETYEAGLALAPTDTELHLGLADTLSHLGRKAETLEHLEAAVRYSPDLPEALNNLAWALATTAEAGSRNGSRAVTLAQHACDLTGWKKTIYVGTLAAAQAEAGKFDEASATAQRACDLASKNGETELLQRNQELLALYRNHRAYHE